MREAAKAVGFAELEAVRIPRTEEDPDFYLDLLEPLSASVDLWHTTYHQLLTGNSGAGGTYCPVGTCGFADMLFVCLALSLPIKEIIPSPISRAAPGSCRSLTHWEGDRLKERVRSMLSTEAVSLKHTQSGRTERR